MNKKAERLDREALIKIGLEALAVDPTASGATLILPDGTMTYFSAETARQLHGQWKPGFQQCP